jgi:CheY-like chemotaxis protein
VNGATGGFDVTKQFNKRNLTTGDIAKLCGVNFRTVIRWIQRGHLKAFQLPGRGDNRVQVADFIEFLNENDMPVPEELMPVGRRVLIVEGDEKIAAAVEKSLRGSGFETQVATDGFQAGAMAGSFNPGVMIVDVGMKGMDGPQAIKVIRDDARMGLAKVIALTPPATSKKKRNELLSAGADEVFDRTVKAKELAARVTDLT